MPVLVLVLINQYSDSYSYSCNNQVLRLVLVLAHIASTRTCTRTRKSGTRPSPAWSSIVEVPYCFSRSYVKFQGHTALKIVEFDPNWAFPDCNSSLNSPMAMKCCTKLETAKERCPIVFQGHPSNFKVTRYKTSPILTQIGRFWTIGQSQLSNPSDLPCLY